MLSEAYTSIHSENEEAPFKGGNIEHDWASHIEAPQFEGVKKILHHSLNEAGLIEEYYIEHNGKLAAVLAEDVTIVMYESHEDDEKEEDETEEGASSDHKEEDEEIIYGGASPKHGVKPKLQGVPLLT